MSSVFIHNVDSVLGECLLEELTELYPSVGGTLSRPSDRYSSLNIVSRDDTPSYLSALLGSDVILFDFHTEDIPLLETTLKQLKAHSFEEPKTMICISSVRVWGETEPKLRPLTAEEIAEFEEEYPDEDERPPLPQTKTDPYTEAEYFKRNPPPQFKKWKNLETLALSIGQNKANLDVYVFCSGIIYGRGEDAFYSLFKAAWLEEPQQLPMIGTGENFIPCIHVSDLARSVKYVLQTRPATRYIFAIDNAQDQSQRSLIEAISSGIGTGKCLSYSLSEVESEDWSEVLSLNIRLKPSGVLIPEEGEEEEEEEEEEEDEEEGRPKKVKIKLDWVCKEGLSTNIRKLNEEFNQARGLVPMKVFITGPPGSGKSHFAQKLASFYNVPWIHASELVEFSQGLSGDFAEKLQGKMGELRDEMVEQLEANKADDEEIDPESVHPRIPDSFLSKICQLRLKENACRNRGYVLDGFPRNHEDAFKAFMMKPKSGEEEEEEEAEEEEEDEEAKRKLILDTSVSPQSVLCLHGNNSELINRVKALPEHALRDTHYNQDDMNRRLKVYRENNRNDSGHPTLMTFFADNDIQVKDIDAFKNENSILEITKIFLERFGAPFNYQTHVEEAERNRIRLLQIARERALAEKKLSEDKLDALEGENRERRMIEANNKLEKIHETEKELLENLAQPVKNYMLENIYEVLSSGLSEVCLKTPEDPIDFLAKYLFQHADKVPHPDPSLY